MIDSNQGYGQLEAFPGGDYWEGNERPTRKVGPELFAYYFEEPRQLAIPGTQHYGPFGEYRQTVADNRADIIKRKLGAMGWVNTYLADIEGSLNSPIPLIVWELDEETEVLDLEDNFGFSGKDVHQYFVSYYNELISHYHERTSGVPIQAVKKRTKYNSFHESVRRHVFEKTGVIWNKSRFIREDLGVKWSELPKSHKITTQLIGWDVLNGRVGNVNYLRGRGAARHMLHLQPDDSTYDRYSKEAIEERLRNPLRGFSQKTLEKLAEDTQHVAFDLETTAFDGGVLEAACIPVGSAALSRLVEYNIDPQTWRVDPESTAVHKLDVDDHISNPEYLSQTDFYEGALLRKPNTINWAHGLFDQGRVAAYQAKSFRHVGENGVFERFRNTIDAARMINGMFLPEDRPIAPFDEEKNRYSFGLKSVAKDFIEEGVEYHRANNDTDALNKLLCRLFEASPEFMEYYTAMGGQEAAKEQLQKGGVFITPHYRFRNNNSSMLGPVFIGPQLETDDSVFVAIDLLSLIDENGQVIRNEEDKLELSFDNLIFIDTRFAPAFFPYDKFRSGKWGNQDFRTKLKEQTGALGEIKGSEVKEIVARFDHAELYSHFMDSLGESDRSRYQWKDIEADYEESLSDKDKVWLDRIRNIRWQSLVDILKNDRLIKDANGFVRNPFTEGTNIHAEFEGLREQAQSSKTHLPV